MYEYAANLVRVVDGDTVILDVSLGFNTWLRSVRFRLARINAPELSTPAGQEAKAWLAGLNFSALRIKSTKQDDYGRWIAELYLGTDPAATINVNDLLVTTGHAVYVKY